MEERLSGLRFKDRDTVRIMGKPPKADPGLCALNAFERTFLVKLNKTFEDNGKDLDLLEKNFLDGKPGFLDVSLPCLGELLEEVGVS